MKPSVIFLFQWLKIEKVLVKGNCPFFIAFLCPFPKCFFIQGCSTNAHIHPCYHCWRSFLLFSPVSVKIPPKFPNFQATCQLDKSLRRLGNSSGVEATNNRVHNTCWHLLITNHSLHSGDLPFWRG